MSEPYSKPTIEIVITRPTLDTLGLFVELAARCGLGGDTPIAVSSVGSAVSVRAPASQVLVPPIDGARVLSEDKPATADLVIGRKVTQR